VEVDQFQPIWIVRPALQLESSLVHKQLGLKPIELRLKEVHVVLEDS